MVIVGENLKQLSEQFNIVDTENNYDSFSITLTLCKHIKRYKDVENLTVVYEESLSSQYVEEIDIYEKYVLNPHSCILACSKENIRIPPGYIGFIQTKGSLARLFVSAHCTDGQIEAGFEGRITFELCNLGNLKVSFMEGVPIAQLFLFKTSSKNPLYKGKYNHSEKPTNYMR